MPGEVKDPTQ